LWPIAVAAAGLTSPPFPPSAGEPPKETKALLHLRLMCLGTNRFADFDPDAFSRLRFFLYGDEAQVCRLYELLFNQVLSVRFHSHSHNPGKAAPAPFSLAPEECILPVGFDREEGLLPYPRQSFLGYRLLTEFFSFPSKFFFLDLGGFDRSRAAQF